ncbi:MAG: ATP-binding protein [Thermoplasmataceae archaeon]
METGEKANSEVLRLIQSASQKEIAKDFKGAFIDYSSASEFLYSMAIKESGSRKLDLINKAELVMKRAISMKENIRGITDKISNSKPIQVSEVQDKLSVGITPLYPETTFADIAGLKDVKERVQIKIIETAKSPVKADLYKVKVGNFLLYGPPGTGKTFIVKAIAHETGFPLFMISPSTLLSSKFGEFEKNIKILFEEASKFKNCILFFDEFDAIAPKRSSTNSSVMKRAVPELLMDIDRLNPDRERRVILIAATNNPWDIDEAVMRSERFDDLIYVPLPDKEAREKMFEMGLSGIFIDKNLNFQGMAEGSEGLTGADIKNVCRKAGENVFMEVLKGSETRPVIQNDIMNVLSTYRPTISQKLLDKYEKFTENARKVIS